MRNFSKYLLLFICLILLAQLPLIATPSDNFQQANEEELANGYPTVVFADSILEQAVREELDLPDWEPLTHERISEITSLERHKISREKKSSALL